jgi:thiamine biosynthesis protein ThiS
VEGLGPDDRRIVKHILINGAPRETAAATIAALVTELGFTRGMVLVEHNGTALRPDEWAARRLVEGDRIELLRLVAGG